MRSGPLRFAPSQHSEHLQRVVDDLQAQRHLDDTEHGAENRQRERQHVGSRRATSMTIRFKTMIATTTAAMARRPSWPR